MKNRLKNSGNLCVVVTLVLSLGTYWALKPLLGSTPANIAGMGVALLGSMYAGVLDTRRKMERKVQAWRESHPGLSDEFLPKQLKGKA